MLQAMETKNNYPAIIAYECCSTKTSHWDLCYKQALSQYYMTYLKHILKTQTKPFCYVVYCTQYAYNISL